MTLSTRIAVMDHGQIVQVGTPNEIYEYPRTRFAAEFIGTMNMFAGVVESVRGEALSVRCDEAGALQSTGATTLIADELLSLTAGLPAFAVLLIVMIVTMTLSRNNFV